MEFKTIYLLTDFSDYAKNAAVYAIEAFGENVNYLLIHSFVIRKTAATLIDIEEIARQEGTQRLGFEIERLEKEFPNLKLKIKSICKYGTPADAINYFLESDPTDLIVVGSKGISKLDEILIGSVTTAIMRGVSIPVLSVPIEARCTPIKNIVLASDLRNTLKPEVTEMVFKLKKVFDAKVFAATVKLDAKDLNEDESGLLEKLSVNNGIDEVTIIRDKNISKGLMDYADSINSDLLVVVAKHTSFFKRFFYKSITKELINHERLPILVLDDN